MWVVQFDASGALYEAKYYDPFDMGSIILGSVQAVVFIANTFDSELFTDVASLEAMQSLYLDVKTNNGVLSSDGTDNYCVMSYTLDFSTALTSTITLKRNCAKINVVIDDEAITDTWTLLNVQVINIPYESYLCADPVPESESGYFNENWYNDNYLTAFYSADGCTFYLPVNERGTAENTEEKNKPAVAPDNATAVKLWYTNPNETLLRTYTFYLGANMTDDFNIMANYAYNYTFNIEDAGNTFLDPRIAMEEWNGVLLDGTIDYTSADYGYSNCYILNPSYEDIIFYIPIEGRINDFWTNYEDNATYQISSGEEWYVDILWSDIETTTELESDGFKVERVTRGYVGTEPSALKVTLPSAFNTSDYSKHGNVVVGVRKSTDNIGDDYCWSWHFWITDYNPDSVTEAPTSANQVGTTTDGGNVFTYGDDYWTLNSGNWIMDRPVGASQVFTDTSMISSARTILYYQYGRKDPFTIYPNGSYSSTNISGNLITTGTVVGGVKSPAKFENTTSIAYNDTDYQGTTYPWNDKKASSMSEKSIFDPSPLGWKVPQNGTWDDFSSNTFVLNSTYLYCYYTISGTTCTYYPALGYLSYTNGSYYNYSTCNAYYWSCSPSTTSSDYAYSLDVYDTTITTNTVRRGVGHPVFAIQE